LTYTGIGAWKKYKENRHADITPPRAENVQRSVKQNWMIQII